MTSILIAQRSKLKFRIWKSSFKHKQNIPLMGLSDSIKWSNRCLRPLNGWEIVKLISKAVSKCNPGRLFSDSSNSFYYFPIEELKPDRYDEIKNSIWRTVLNMFCNRGEITFDVRVGMIVKSFVVSFISITRARKSLNVLLTTVQSYANALNPTWSYRAHNTMFVDIL